MIAIPSVVNWYGGKSKLARQIISIMPEHEHYIEVFMGSAAVFFAKPKVARNVINDVNINLVNLFIQVRDNCDELLEKAYWTLYSREQYDRFEKLSQFSEELSPVDKALMYLFLVKSNFNSQLGTGFSASIDSNSANFNLSMLERLKCAREKLDGVVIENRDCSEIIKKYDQSGSFFYLDPPYYVANDISYYYEHNFKTVQHEWLAMTLAGCKSPWILSYDDVPEIIELYKDFTITRTSVIYSLGRDGINRKLDELFITNFHPKKVQLDIFDEKIVETEEVSDEEKLDVEKQIKLKQEVEYENQINEIRKNEPIKRSKPRPTKQGDLFNTGL